MVELLALSIKCDEHELNKIVETHPEFYEISILDANGKIICSSSEPHIGLDKSNDDYFINAKEKTYIKDAFYDEEFGKNSIAISTPIFNEAGEFSEIFVARMKISELNKITTDRTGLGETGEIYLINSEGYMITLSRFLSGDLTFLKLKVDTKNSKECLEDLEEYYMEATEEGAEEVEEHEEEISVFEDYRGVKVLGTHAYVPEMPWCLLAEIDEEEALDKLKDELLKTVFIVLIAILVIMMVFIFLSGYLIEKLVKEAKKGKRR